jgi:hypothetical protein
MNRFNFGSEIPNLAAILAGGRRASQHSCRSSSSAVAGVHGLKTRAIASIRRQPRRGLSCQQWLFRCFLDVTPGIRQRAEQNLATFVDRLEMRQLSVAFMTQCAG